MASFIALGATVNCMVLHRAEKSHALGQEEEVGERNSMQTGTVATDWHFVQSRYMFYKKANLRNKVHYAQLRFSGTEQTERGQKYLDSYTQNMQLTRKSEKISKRYFHLFNGGTLQGV